VREFSTLCKLCWLSKTMFDVGLVVVQRYYWAENPPVGCKSIYHQVKNNENYDLLSNDIAQQTLKVVDYAFKSFVKFIEVVSDCLYFRKVNTPYYLPQRGYFILIIPPIKVKDGFFDESMSPTFRKKYGEVRIPFPERLVDKTVKEVKIIPRYEARFFEVESIVEEKLTLAHLDSGKMLSIAPGQNNLVTYVDTKRAFFMRDDKSLKLINHWFNAKTVRWQRMKEKQRYQHLTERQSRLDRKQNHRVRDYLNQTVSYPINYCWTRQIGKLVIGCKPNWKQDINLSKQNNQISVQMPHDALVRWIAMVRQIYSKKVTTIWIAKEWLGGF
jgi:putative transposase